MNEIEKQSIKQAILENISAYPGDYSVQSCNGGVTPTDDCCSAIATYIDNEYNNNPDCEKFGKDEYVQVCIDSFNETLNLADDNFSNTGSTLEFLTDEVHRYLMNN